MIVEVTEEQASLIVSALRLAKIHDHNRNCYADLKPFRWGDSESAIHAEVEREDKRIDADYGELIFKFAYGGK